MEMQALILTTDVWGLGGVERYSRSFCLFTVPAKKGKEVCCNV
jgi:hypothetical protein